MPVLALFSAVLVVTFEQITQWRYGTSGIVGLLLLVVGVKVKSSFLSSVGGVTLALLVARPLP
ncbi:MULTISPECIES: hypothetical protein [Streptomyces]|uniref:hypothetical protein n=1 Tax=Streptomyces TaxID=1883 RepID=UPI0036BBC760